MYITESVKHVQTPAQPEQANQMKKVASETEYQDLKSKLVNTLRDCGLYINFAIPFKGAESNEKQREFNSSVHALNSNIQVYLALKGDPEDEKEFLKIIVSNLKVAMKYIGEVDKQAIDPYTRQCIASVKDLNDVLSKIDYLPLIDKKV